MVSIRLSRGGAKKRPFYHIVVTDSRKKRDGAHLERVGFYNPVAAANERELQFDRQRIDYWLSRGAKLSDTVASLLRRAGGSS